MIDCEVEYADGRLGIESSKMKVKSTEMKKVQVIKSGYVGPI
jgi:hypothetical protein